MDRWTERHRDGLTDGQREIGMTGQTDGERHRDGRTERNRDGRTD
jgi:hypothetical protein